MKKLLGIVVLGLLLSGCADSSGSRPFGPTPIDVGRIIESNEHFIKIVTDRSVTGEGTNYTSDSLSKIQKVAKAHCAKYKKYAHFFAWDFDKQGSYYRCHEIPKNVNDAGKKAHWSSYPDKPWEKPKKKVVKKTEPKKKVVEKKEPKKTPDDNKVVAASMGSGFFVTRAGHLVTNYHVIEGCNAVKTNISGKEVRTDIIAVDKTNDLAIIKAEMNPSKVFPVSNEDVSLMQDVIVAGFPLGKKVSSTIKIHKGSVTALAGFGDNYSNFQTDATINQGNSGGPIMNQNGNVVGVAVQLITAEHAQNIFFGVKSSTLKTFANANNIKFLTPNRQKLSNEDLGKLITDATVFLECWMTVAKIKQIIAQEENRKAFYREYQ